MASANNSLGVPRSSNFTSRTTLLKGTRCISGMCWSGSCWKNLSVTSLYTLPSCPTLPALPALCTIWFLLAHSNLNWG